MSFETDSGTSEVINYKMSGTFKHVINMANSIIGVSILSMPYCFKEAGLVLGILLILISGFITKKTCMYLIRAAIMSRRRSYELLAFQVFGVTGKLLMEMCMILFLIGICISFHVVMGDLAPAIVAKYMVIENSPALRCTLLVGMVLLVILPLCLLRNLDSLASMSACSIGFYVFLNCIIFYMALPNLLDGTWFSKAKLFHFDSAFRVLPIMTLALSCQSNVFEIYDSIPDPDVIKMKNVVSQAVNICCALYIGVGFLGYIAFIDTDVTGNIIMKFPVSKMTDCITIFFVVSLAISFPLMLFPCRTSIHSLCYKRNTQISYDLVGNYMPESRFKGITLAVLFSSLVIGILLPNIEFVLGLLGSTMGVTIAFILPSVFYIKVYTKTSCDRLLAQGFLLLGIFIMVTGTYLHLSGLQQNTDSLVTLPPEIKKIEDIAKNIPVDEVLKVPAGVAKIEEKAAADMTGRKEPAIPEPPNSEQEAEVKIKPAEPAVNVANDKVGKEDSVINAANANADNKIDIEQSKKLENEEVKIVKKDVKDEDKQLILDKNDGKGEVLHPDAIKKEEKENMEESLGKANIETKQEEILKQMEHQQKEQKKLIEEQKKILQELKDQKEKIDVVQKEKIVEVKPELKIKEEAKQIPPLNIENNIIGSDQKILPSLDMNNLSLENKQHDVEVLPPKVEDMPKIPVNILQLQPIQNLPQIPKQNFVQPIENLPQIPREDGPQFPSKNLPEVPVESLLNLPIVNLPPKSAPESQVQKLKMPAIRMDKKPVEDNHRPAIRMDKKPVEDNHRPSIRMDKIPVEDNHRPAIRMDKIPVEDNHRFDAISNDVKNSVNDYMGKEISQGVVLPQKVEAIKISQDMPILGKEVNSKSVKQPHVTLKKLINNEVREDVNAAEKPVVDSKPIAKGKKLPQGINMPLEDPAVKHDEERRKRDVSSLTERKDSKAVIPPIQLSHRDISLKNKGESESILHPPIQESDKLSFNVNVNLEETNKVFDSESKYAVDALFETRHLLWLKRGRRKKRRNEQFPEYWDEI